MSINDGTAEKNCSYCGEAIPVDSRRCRYCGSILKENKAEADNGGAVYREEADNQEAVYKEESTLSNGLKVFLSVIYTLIPGIGQIAGIIHGIAMSYSKIKDTRSFGKALIIAMVLVFMIYCVFIYVLTVALITIYYYIA